jgi:hypothetical protein
MTTPRTDDPSSPPTAIVGLSFAVLFVVVVLGLQAYFARVQDEEREAKRQGVGSAELAGVEEAQLQRIGEYRWVDRDSGVVAIPIERAMELVVAEQAASAGARP